MVLPVPGGGGGVHDQHAALFEPHVAALLVVRVPPVLVGAAEVVPGAVGCGRCQGDEWEIVKVRKLKLRWEGSL